MVVYTILNNGIIGIRNEGINYILNPNERGSTIWYQIPFYNIATDEVEESITQQQIDDRLEAQEKQTVAQLLAQFENDGKAFFHEIRVLVMYHYNKGTISEVQFNAIKDILRPAIAPLLIGEWDQAQINIDALNRPSGVLGNLYDFVKGGIDDYLN
jgi:bifunctional ADP-heptose synthase (sugar kinase/adenylyltransferase)